MLNPNQILNARDSKTRLIAHPFLKRMRQSKLSKTQAEIVLGQWYHPLHYFPNFLSGLIGLTPSIEGKTAISKILFQELGEGQPENAHERMFIQSMTDVGITKSRLVDAPMLPATRQLMESFYHFGTASNATALGCVFATEAADVAMVAAIGLTVRKMTGVSELPWVDIHVTQESEHIASVESLLLVDLCGQEIDVMIQTADTMFDGWCAFFDDIEKAVDSVVGDYVASERKPQAEHA